MTRSFSARRHGSVGSISDFGTTLVVTDSRLKVCHAGHERWVCEQPCLLLIESWLDIQAARGAKSCMSCTVCLIDIDNRDSGAQKHEIRFRFEVVGAHDSLVEVGLGFLGVNATVRIMAELPNDARRVVSGSHGCLKVGNDEQVLNTSDSLYSEVQG